jgi:hypothetical protein
LTISSWYFSARNGHSDQHFARDQSYEVNTPSLAKLRSAKAAWHCTFKLGESIKATRLCTSFGSVCASFFRLAAGRRALDQQALQNGITQW